MFGLKTDMHVMYTDVPMVTGVVIGYCNSQSPVQNMLDNYTQSITLHKIKHAWLMKIPSILFKEKGILNR